ncbi:MAG TPA: hypothetical protein VG942_10855 [Hyphomonadaceae bacterium]|nr:hypothetical protein [Hyphomonadaceae bacterium]
MRALKSIMMSAFAGVALVTLVACDRGGSGALAPVKTDPAAVEALVTKLGTESFKTDGKGGAADVASVAAALPKDVKVTWGSLNFDAASGATVLTDVKVVPTDMPTIGVNIAELRLWDFDAAFAKARLSGQRLAESGKLARRIQATNMSVFGLETLFTQALGGDANQGLGTDGAPQLKHYSFTVAKMIYDDVQLRPYETMSMPAPKTGGMADASLQMSSMGDQFLSVFRSFGVDTSATYDMKADFEMAEGPQDIKFNFGMKSAGTRGMRGYDNDAGFVRDMSFTASTSGSPSEPAVNFGGKLALATTQDMRMDKLFSYIGKQQVPPRTETNVFSYGLYQAKDLSVNVGGADVFTMGDMSIDARQFYWLVPTNLKFSFNNMSLDMKQIMKLAEQMQAMENPDFADSPEAKAEMEQGMAMIEKLGLSKPSLDFNLGWTWDPTKGDGAIDLGTGLDNFMHTTFNYQGGFPSFKAVSDLIPDDVSKANFTGVQSEFAKSTTLKSMDLTINDEGGLAKIFQIAAEVMAQQAGPNPDPSNPFAGASPESLRQIAVGMISASADTMKKQVPEAAPLATAVVNFLQKGGKLHISVKPKTPLQFATMDQTVMASADNPAALIKQFNVTADQSGESK